jgi:hypothetical protein
MELEGRIASDLACRKGYKEVTLVRHSPPLGEETELLVAQ